MGLSMASFKVLLFCFTLHCNVFSFLKNTDLLMKLETHAFGNISEEHNVPEGKGTPFVAEMTLLLLARA